MMPTRILIVTYNWPPRNAIGTLRPYAWAKYWSQAGADVTVLTAKKHEFDAPLDLDFPVLPGLRVIEVPYGGTGLSLVNRLVRNSKARAYLKKMKSMLLDRRIATDPRSAWRAAARADIEKLAMENDVVVSTFGPDASHLIAFDAKTANPDLIWIADYRDLWSQNHHHQWPDHVRAEVHELERATVGLHADIITAVSEDMVVRLSEFCRGEVLLARNGYDLTPEELRTILSAPFSLPSKPLRLVHTGTVSSDRDPSPLLATLADMVDNKEIEPGDVIVEFYGTRVGPIIDLMSNRRFRPFLRTPGHVSRDEALRIQRDASALILLESSAPEARGVLTGKIFEYISAGRPIICIGSSAEFEIGLMLSKTGTGIVASEQNLECTIKGLLTPGSKPAWFSPVYEEIALYSRKRQSLDLLSAITKAGV